MTRTFRTSMIALMVGALAACGGGAGSSTGSSPESGALSRPTNDHLPASIDVKLPDSLKSGGQASDPAGGAANDALQADLGGGFVPGESFGFWQVQSLAEEVEYELADLRFQMRMVDSFIGQIQTQCEGVAVDTACTVPASSLSLVVTPEMAAGFALLIEELQAAEALSEFNEEDLDGELGAEDDSSIEELFPAIGSPIMLQAIVSYTERSSGDYRYELNLDYAAGEGAVNRTDQVAYRWSDDRRSMMVSYEFAEQDYSDSESLVYEDRDDGDFLKLRNQYQFSNGGQDAVQGNYAFQFQEVAGDGDPVRFESSFGDTFGGTSFQMTFNGEANVDGGEVLTRTEMTGMPAFLQREQFDADGQVVKAAECVETVAGDCDNEANWSAGDGGTGEALEMLSFAEVDGLDELSFSAESDISIQGLPADVEYGVVVVTQNGSADNWEDHLCVGFRFGDEDPSVDCWVDTEDLAGAAIYSEQFSGDSMSYRLESGATIVFGDD